MATTEYQSQAARDAQRGGYGDQSYWDYLETSSLEKRDYFLRYGQTELATSMLTRSLSEALAGNDGE